MIEYNLMQLLQTNDNLGMDFSINTTTLKDDVVTVYSSSGQQPSSYEGVLTKPRYQVIVRSSDYDKATEIAYNVYEQLNAIENTIMPVELKTRTILFKVYKVYALHEPALLGTTSEGVMEYSLNFETQMIKV
ncbi:minor capsid protein [Staphylococcus xylosus]|uniref:minor capsid protein n=1 Tax=Staphylococcus xylosus TaxID=1288 RepID=UPI000D1EDED9|nr:minor capsid protein [Staphylococcus xylosus]PTI27883.1 minor capsid protein [Staphylococcus xylosus]HDP5827237.1 minor capsid protein [Staphylococcus aureus]